MTIWGNGILKFYKSVLLNNTTSPLRFINYIIRKKVLKKFADKNKVRIFAE